MKHYIIRVCQILCVLALIMGIGLGIVSASHTTSAIGISAKEPTTDTTTSVPNSSNAPDMDALSAKIETIIDQSDLEVGVSAIDLQSSQQIDVGESAAFLGASTTKVLTGAYYMHQVEQGEASLQTIIDGSSAKELIHRMLTQSDNAAWASLNDYLGKASLQTYASQLGLSSYDSASNTITVHDQAQLLAKLQAHKLADQDHTDTLLSFMQHTNDETLIPAALPTTATVYHKYGQLYGELHDSAIVTYQGQSFVLVIFTKSDTETITDLTSRTQLFHDVTNATIETYAE